MAARTLAYVRLFPKHNLTRQQSKGFLQEFLFPAALQLISTASEVRRTFSGANNQNSKVGSRDTRLLRVAVIGEPNSGKSTLTNSLVCNQVSVVTNVPHTTRQRTLGVYTEGIFCTKLI